MIVDNIPCLMSRLASDCTGPPIRNVWINNQMTSVWNTGAFTSVALRGWGEEPRPFPITLELGGVDADLLFEVECRKADESNRRKVAVRLHLHNSWGGLWTTVSVICPPDIFKAIDFDRVDHSLAVCAEPESTGCPDEYVVYKDKKRDCRDMTLVEDVPHCRKVVSHLCRELTEQLYDLGYWLRPFISSELLRC